MAPWIAANLGKKVTHDLPRLRLRLRPPRLLLRRRSRQQGGEVVELDRHPADRDAPSPATSRRSRPTPRCIYHVMVGPAVLTFVKELGEFYGSQPAADLRLHRLARGRRHRQPRPGVPGRHALLGGLPALHAGRRTPTRESFYRAAVGVDDNGAASATPRTSPPTPTCSAAGRRSSSSSRRWRTPATRARTTAPSWSRRPRR